MQQPTATPTLLTVEHKLATLESILSTLERTRASLPSLIRTVLPSPPTQDLAQLQSTAAADRAVQYRAASSECNSAIRALSDQLEAIEPILSEADQSAEKDQSDILVRPSTAAARRRARAAGKGDTNGASWDKVGEILAAGGGASSTRATSSGRGRSVAFEVQHPVPSSPAQLNDLLATWSTSHPRVRVQITRTRTRAAQEEQPVELGLTLRGVMRARIALRWEEDSGCEAEYVACYSLKEDEKPLYVDSQFSLFRSLSNRAMAIIDQRRRARAGTAVEPVHSLEEVLAFLSDPPLPF
ncbi:hypothetical protein JCM10908_006212 [Rhodotorula pacifica]|uniref:uncharacterized protein n=1 Tax=Rhodotorula pacifica TaxID=1495444 RepID=UPI0031798FF2